MTLSEELDSLDGQIAGLEERRIAILGSMASLKDVQKHNVVLIPQADQVTVKVYDPATHETIW